WIDRKGSGKPIHVPSSFVCVCGGLVPDLLGDLADDEGRADGFLDRVLFSYPDLPPIAKWTDTVISSDARNGWKNVLTKLFSLHFDADPKGRKRAFTLRMTAGANEVWREFYDSWEPEMRVQGQLAGAWSKLRAYCARLALILQLLRWACGEAGADEVDEI